MLRFRLRFSKLLAFWCVLSLCALARTSHAQQSTPTPVPAPLPLDRILDDMQGAPLDVVKLAASQQAEADGPRFRSAPTAVPFYQTFEGSFEPLDAQTRLALFSDDGCDVWIDGVQVLARKNTGQDMLVQSESLHLLDFTPQSGRAYRIKVDYSNTIHLGQTDMDGVTLFAYTFDPTSNEEPDITLSFPKSVYRMGEITRAEVEVSGPPSLLGRDVMVALDGPGTITPQRFPMSVGSTRFVQVTMPMAEGQHIFRARIEGQSALDEAAVGISVFDERGPGGDSGWRLYEPSARSGGVGLYWDAYPFPGPRVVGYRVFWSADGGAAGSGSFDVTGGQTSANHLGLTNGVTYSYFVRALLDDNTHESDAQTNTVYGTPRAEAPERPFNLSATARADGSVKLEWTASTTQGVQAYWIYRGTQQGSYDYIAKTIAPSNSTIDYGLSEGTYWYVVEAVKDNVGSGQSNPAWVQLLKPGVPATPLSFSAQGLDRKVSLSWGESAGANTFRIRRRVAGQADWTQWEVPGSVHAYEDTDEGAGLSNGVRYEYELYGVNWGGASSAATAWATPQGNLPRERPSIPSFATAVAGDGFVKVTWGESQRANHYAVKRRIVASETRFWDQKTQIAADPHLFIDRNVVNGAAYQYQVVAINESGDSEPATTAEVTPRASVQPDGMFEVEQGSGTRSLSGSGDGSPTELAVSPDGHLGNNVYNSTGVGQTWSVQALRGQTITFNLRIQNDGRVRDTLVISGPKESDGWKLTYQDTVTGSGDIDQQIKSGTFSVVLAPGAYRNLRLLVTPAATVSIGQVRSTAVRATSSANPKQVDVIVAQVKTVTEPITAKFGGLTSGEIRLCAGGVAVDSVHSGTYSIQLLKGTTAIPNAAISLEIAGNISLGKKAQFVSGTDRSETLPLTTDAGGNASFTLLSSDTISTARVLVKYGDILAGFVNCRFERALSLRRRGIETFVEGFPLDTGWLSTPEVLSSPGERATVRAHLKWRKDATVLTIQEYFDANKKPLPSLADDSNWLAVNGHRLRIRIRQIAIKTANGETAADPNTYDDYVRILGVDANGVIEVVTRNYEPDAFKNRGVGQFQVEAGPMIDKVLWFAFEAEDLDQHAK